MTGLNEKMNKWVKHLTQSMTRNKHSVNVNLFLFKMVAADRIVPNNLREPQNKKEKKLKRWLF